MFFLFFYHYQFRSSKFIYFVYTSLIGSSLTNLFVSVSECKSIRARDQIEIRNLPFPTTSSDSPFVRVGRGMHSAASYFSFPNHWNRSRWLVLFFWSTILLLFPLRFSKAYIFNARLNGSRNCISIVAFMVRFIIVNYLEECVHVVINQLGSVAQSAVCICWKNDR